MPTPDRSTKTAEGYLDRLREDLADDLDYDVQDGPPLASYPLHLAEGREGFLERLVDFGEPGVFAAVSHVWSSLAPPAAARCTQMGLHAGVGGKGKQALHGV